MNNWIISNITLLQVMKLLYLYIDKDGNIFVVISLQYIDINQCKYKIFILYKYILYMYKL